MNAKEWFEANNRACFSGCVSGSSWEDCDFMHDEITKLFEAAQPKWLPIESAPKDGVLIWLGNASGVWVGYYLRLYQSGYQPKNPWSSMMLHHEHMKVVDLTPTHWQPLPEPPKQ